MTHPCPNCGTPIISGASFCTSCGAQLGSTPPPPIEAPAAPPIAAWPAQQDSWDGGWSQDQAIPQQSWQQSPYPPAPGGYPPAPGPSGPMPGPVGQRRNGPGPVIACVVMVVATAVAAYFLLKSSPEETAADDPFGAADEVGSGEAQSDDTDDHPADAEGELEGWVQLLESSCVASADDGGLPSIDIDVEAYCHCSAVALSEEYSMTEIAEMGLDSENGMPAPEDMDEFMGAISDAGCFTEAFD